jgi:hypothetical protein
MSKPRLSFTVVGELLKGQVFLFDGEQAISIGRTADNAMPLDHKSVSRRHATVECNGERVVLRDLGSHNGTRVGERLVTEHVLQPGEIVGFGEILLRFAMVDGAGAPEAAAQALPAIVPASQDTMTALAQPMDFDELYARAGPTQPVAPEAPPTRRVHPQLIYGLLLAVTVMLGLIGFWRVGQRPPKPPMISVQLRVGDVVPVNVAWQPKPDGLGWLPALRAAESIGQPLDERVADARKTKFRTYVAVHGKALGTTDIPVLGPPLGRLTLRVLVRGIRPESEARAWKRRPVSDRRDYGRRLLERARRLRLRPGAVGPETAKVVHDLELASELLQAIPGEGHRAAEASRESRILRRALDARFDELARRLDILFAQGKLDEAIIAARELVALYPDPETEEYHIVNAYYRDLLREVARADQEAQEKR